MSTVIEMQSLSSGLTQAALEKLTWAEFNATDGILRMALVQDLERNDIRPEVRLDAEALQRLKPGATSIRPQGVGDFRYELTTEWKPVRARFANALVAAAREDANLGARRMEAEKVDRLGNVVAPPRSVRGEPNLIEYRLPGDTALVVPGRKEK